MLDPILSKLQHQLLESVLSNIEALLGSRNNRLANGASLQARSSEFDNLITQVARKHGVEASLLKAVAQAESNFSPTAVSHAGAKGMMQLMDATAQSLGVADVFDPVQNLEGGAKFLRQMLNRYNGNEALALAAYNAGPGAVDKWGGVPPYQETQTYVPRILSLRDQYREWSA
jgi:soluble lytic murein transglycosylase-like protein